ncbi:hypothetical protein [Microcoleus sp. FACHB-68]|uniref:hypothetical protein n=1 Tax=Microcoleus sp. FACHB-68 TaxID=2692826 RepID=UPI00168674B2|nr:hypothetical protein [Microcoleus sp. FACHB-68]MBD1940511.1 hypothetical protein [Microcoleus sp. FACHB-68]
MLDAQGLFNENFYLSQNQDVAIAVNAGIYNNGYEHFELYGKSEGRNPSAFFDQGYYIDTNSDVTGNAFDHFILHGQFEGRNPNAIFDTGFYLDQNPDVKADVDKDVITGIEHFIENGQFESREVNPFFDESYYLETNADVAAAVAAGATTAIEQYMGFGQFEANRNPNALFDTNFYLQNNADVATAVSSGGTSAIEHFVVYGQFETNRTSQFLFDPDFYLQNNSDVATAVSSGGTSAIEHYVVYGQFENNRQPSSQFNPNFYLQNNADVAADVSNGNRKSAIEHYIRFGIAEGRSGGGETVNPSAIYVSSNGTGNVGDVDQFIGTLNFQKRFDAGNNEGVELDELGNLYQAGDVTAGAGSIRAISQIANRANGDAFTALKDREIAGSQTGLLNPKGIAIAQEAGFILVADNGAGDVKVFGTAAGGNVPPVATTALPAKPWDVAYDENADRLFVALVDGTVSVFDNYIGNGSNIGAGSSRRINLVNASGTKVSTNLHGIVYEPNRNQLVVTDVGAATAMQSSNFNSDGRIYVINNASAADGNVVPSRTLEGPATQLGNPVDMILTGNDVQVAEKAKDRLLIFRNIFNGPSGDIAPQVSVSQIKPESLVAQLSQGPANPDVTDIESTGTLINSIVTTSNPPSAGATDFVARLSTNLQTTQTTFNTANGVASVENITFDQTGDAFITFDTNDTNGGILVVNRQAESRNGGTFSASRDRLITGVNTGMVSPKGVEVADSLGLVFVAENNAATPAILAFSTQAQGDVAPVFKTTDLGGRRPWDVDYAPSQDRLFVAATDGTVLVYDQYSVTQGANGPTRVITPFDPTGTAKASINLHGIIYVESSDTLLLSDVGSAMSATDGQLFVINNAGAANGNVAVRAQIAGANSKLGNPVDITFDGANLYVAEKSNNLIMRFDGILNQLGSLDIAPTLSTARNKPESVALAPDYLS